MALSAENIPLKRELGLFSTTVAGVGIILGAGIYALIGIAAGETGNTIWLSFLIASIVALFTGLSYAELSSIFKGDAGEYVYCRTAFGKKIAWLISVMIIITGIVSAATVALGFAGYFVAIFKIVPYVMAALFLIIAMSFLNFYGIKGSSRFNIIATTIEFLGLIIIILLGVGKFGSSNLLEMPHGLAGVFSSAALVFFAFMGFETIVKLREETKNPEKTIPKAIILSIIISSVVYILVAISAVSILPAEQIASSSSPLATVAASSFGNPAFIVLAIIALFSTSNTVLLTMLTTSRMTYGMSKEKSLPKFLANVHKRRRTPYFSVLIICLATLLLALIGNIELVADITNILLFFTFFLINISLIVLRYKLPGKRAFKIPFNIGRFSLTALLGALTSLILLFFAIINIIK